MSSWIVRLAVVSAVCFVPTFDVHAAPPCGCAHCQPPCAYPTGNWYDVGGAGFPGPYPAYGAAGYPIAQGARAAARGTATFVMGPGQNVIWPDSRKRYFHLVPTSPVYGYPAHPQWVTANEGPVTGEPTPAEPQPFQESVPPPEEIPDPEDLFPPRGPFDGQVTQAAAVSRDDLAAPDTHWRDETSDAARRAPRRTLSWKPVRQLPDGNR